ncbi:MAG: putative gamma-glutamyltransferase YwrD [Alphaproteobacteria bacterium MarineAlpha4_Bin2]|nr:MAG: putative gamma-glutamyltransferase YwrD [Alphaproteobacteria bacterium MarineAlpha4_Bin2]
MFTTRPELLGTFGMVSSTHWLTSAAAMAMLEKGGNAFDAAVAGGLMLQVCEPHLNGPGGDMPAILHDATSGKTKVVCGQGTAPAGATIDHYNREGLNLIPGTGLLATVVPGAFDAWMLMLRDYGTKSVKEVFETALNYAYNGVPVVPRWTDTVATVAELFRDEWTTSAAQWLVDGKPPKPGSLYANRPLASTWNRLIAEALAASGDRVEQIEAIRFAWHEGFVAEAVDKFCRETEVLDASGERHKAVLTGDDMSRWRASYDAPATYDFGNYTMMKPGVWSQGPAHLQVLALLKGFDLTSMDPTGTEFVHTVTEAIKLAFADRDAFYGDPDFVEVPIDRLLSDAYNDERRKMIGDTASNELRHGTIDDYGCTVDYAAAVGRAMGEGVPLGGKAAAGAGEPTVGALGQTAGDTCHIDVVDKEGNMVACMPSGGWLQSSPTIPTLGFQLNSRAQMFWLDEGQPMSLEPGKRPRTTLSPSMALRDGKPYVAFGTPGGDQQDQWQSIFFLRHAVYGRNLQEAIDTPSFHSEHFVSSFYPRGAQPQRLVVEGRTPPETVQGLRERGHKVEVGELWSEGRLCAVSQDNAVLKAGSNARGMQGYAAGR